MRWGVGWGKMQTVEGETLDTSHDSARPCNCLWAWSTCPACLWVQNKDTHTPLSSPSSLLGLQVTHSAFSSGTGFP